MDGKVKTIHVLFTVSHDASWENLFQHKDILLLRIISFVLITCEFHQEVILLGEIRCLSQLGLKGLFIYDCLCLFKLG